MMGNNMFKLWLEKFNVGLMCIALVLGTFLAAGCVSQSKTMVQPSEHAAGDAATGGASDAEALPMIQSVELVPGADAYTLKVEGNRPLSCTAIQQDFPYGVVAYFPGVEAAQELVGRTIEGRGPVGQVEISVARTAKPMVKVAVLLKQDADYEVIESANTVELVLSQADAQPQAEPVQAQAVLPESDLNRIQDIALVPEGAGHTQIRLETDRPVQYSTQWKTDRILGITLQDTGIPQARQIVLSSKVPQSSVERVTPAMASLYAPSNAEVSIHVKQQVPFQVQQDGKVLTLTFDPVAPAVVEKAEPAAEKAAPVVAQAPAAPENLAPAGPPEAYESPMDMMKKPKYTGEKIRLDFYETDIKNVFRILKSVSGQNFAVDKDVKGKVTLALDKPVPWDQVLDLVLKMNGLGRKYESNVIRIATVETLKKEELFFQEALEARKRARDQKMSLEPLVTEYIPINYSDAAGDIEPNITPLLSEERGKISVDKRTNMIIVTDTREKIEKIQDMIYRLDTVTPQIMIEAKIVEVTKKFSRSIGMGFNFSNATATTGNFVDDFSLSLNQPSGGGISGDISFFHLFGSSRAALNARLDASEELGNVRIVSSPRILTLDNKKARIKQGVEYAYLERDDSGGSSVEFKDIDLLLEVTPHVTPDQRISMTVVLTKNDIAGVTSSGAPTLSTNEAETELLVNNNDTVVIGGIVKNRTNEDNKALPFLSQVPVLNKVFGTDLDEEERNELLIFLTPTIVQLEQKRGQSSRMMN